MSSLVEWKEAWRHFRRSAGLWAAVGCLALASGAATGVFTIVKNVLLQSLSYPDANRLVTLERRTVEGMGILSSWEDFWHWQQNNRALDEVAAVSRISLIFDTGGAESPRRIEAGFASAEFFKLLGGRPETGRLFSIEDDEPGSAAVVVLASSFWRGQLGGDPDQIGRSIRLNGQAALIVGVVSDDFQPPEALFPLPVEAWIALGSHPHRTSAELAFHLLGRLKKGVAIEQARAEMDGLPRPFPPGVIYPGWTNAVDSLLDRTIAHVRPALLLLSAVVGLVLLIACANAGNILLNRFASRRPELAVRAALGARRRDLVRLCLIESGLVCVQGGVLGAILAAWWVRFFTALAPASVPRLETVQPDAGLILLAAALTLLVTLAVGLIPVAGIGAGGLARQAGLGGRASREGFRIVRLRDLLVVVQIALTAVLVLGAVQLSTSFLRLQRQNLGFSPQHVSAMPVELDQSRYSKAEQWQSFFGALLDRVQSLPDVESASMVNLLPLSGNFASEGMKVSGPHVLRPDETIHFTTLRVAPDYFSTMGIPLLEGRDFSDVDSGRQVMIVNQAFRTMVWGARSPLGEEVNLGGRPYQVVAVAADVKQPALDRGMTPQRYIPFRQRPTNRMEIVVRSQTSPVSLSPALRNLLRSLDPRQPVSPIRSLNQLISRGLSTYRFYSLLFTFFGVATMLVAAAGVYGAVSQTVARRLPEIGIRLALGARPRDVTRSILSLAGTLGLTGIAVGLALAWTLSRHLQSLLYQVDHHAPGFYAGTGIFLLLTTVLAAFRPARAASRTDPAETLRST
ncbi:MAG: ABC transporter permease [Acidobacteriota bacterium]